jgi:hypothetical protein
MPFSEGHGGRAGAVKRGRHEAQEGSRPGAAVRRARGDAGEPGEQNKKRPGGSAQVLDKAQNGQENPSFLPRSGLAGV